MADPSPSNRVRVAVRSRPLNKADSGDTNIAVSVDGNTVALTTQSSRRTERAFDWAFSEDDQNDAVFAAFGRELVDDAWSGYISTVFAYGQTGSGKTHSITGSDADPGLVPRCIDYLFSRVATAPETKVEVSCLELYNEKLHDLLQSPAPSPDAIQSGRQALQTVDIRGDTRRGFRAAGVRSVTVTSLAQFADLAAGAASLRFAAETAMNTESSRSHAIINVVVTTDTTKGVLRFVDLAGSESLGRSGAEGDRAVEARNINTSLHHLGILLSKASAAGTSGTDMRDRMSECRNSALTKLLSDVFAGDSKCVMLATVSPTRINASETASTLSYAHKAKAIAVDAKKTEVTALSHDELSGLRDTYVAQLVELARQLDDFRKKAAAKLESLRSQRAALSAHAACDAPPSVAAELATLEEENGSLTAEVAELHAELSRLAAPPTLDAPGGSDAVMMRNDPAAPTLPRLPGAREMGKLVQRVSAHTNSIYGLALSPEGRRVFLGSADATPSMWLIPQRVGDPEAKHDRTYSAFPGPITCTAWHPAGDFLAACCMMRCEAQHKVTGGRIVFFDITSGSTHGRLTIKYPAFDMRFAPIMGRTVLAVVLGALHPHQMSGCGRIRLYEFQEKLCTIEVRGSRVLSSVAWNHLGTQVAAAGSVVSVWKASIDPNKPSKSDKKLVTVFTATPSKERSHAKEVRGPYTGVAFSNDGANLAVSTTWGEILLFHPHKGQTTPFATIPLGGSQEFSLWSPRWSRSGHMLAAIVWRSTRIVFFDMMSFHVVGYWDGVGGTYKYHNMALFDRTIVVCGDASMDIVHVDELIPDVTPGADAHAVHTGGVHSDGMLSVGGPVPPPQALTPY